MEGDCQVRDVWGLNSGLVGMEETDLRSMKLLNKQIGGVISMEFFFKAVEEINTVGREQTLGTPACQGHGEEEEP